MTSETPDEKKLQGRPPGAVNRTTPKLKGNILNVFSMLGGEVAMTAWAKANPGDFYTKVWVKLLPQEIKGSGFIAPPEKVTKADSDKEFARKVAYALNAGLYEMKNEELLAQVDASGQPN